MSERTTTDSENRREPDAGPVQLVDSGLFFSAASPLPKGIKARDVEALARGLVEEHAPLPLEQTSWGYLVDHRGKAGPHLLYYAATRQSLFGRKAENARDLRPAAVLPAFVALAGLRFARRTCVFLEEAECVSAVLFEPGATVPNRIVSRFLSEAGTDAEPARDELARRIEGEQGETELLPGTVRVAEAVPRGKGAVFHLEQRDPASGEWVSWKRTGIDKEARLLAADVRDRETLGAGARKQASGKRILRVAAALIAATLLLGALEIVQLLRGREAESLRERAEAREAQVERLQDIEAMAQSLEELLQGRFEPFDWLQAVNETRPEAVFFTSYALDDEGRIRINGQAPEVKILNEYIAALNEDPRLAEVEVGDTETDEDGVRFSLRAAAGDIDAEPPEEPAASGAPAGESTGEQAT